MWIHTVKFGEFTQTISAICVLDETEWSDKVFCVNSHTHCTFHVNSHIVCVNSHIVCVNSHIVCVNSHIVYVNSHILCNFSVNYLMNSHTVVVALGSIIPVISLIWTVWIHTIIQLPGHIQIKILHAFLYTNKICMCYVSEISMRYNSMTRVPMRTVRHGNSIYVVLWSQNSFVCTNSRSTFCNTVNLKK